MDGTNEPGDGGGNSCKTAASRASSTHDNPTDSTDTMHSCPCLDVRSRRSRNEWERIEQHDTRTRRTEPRSSASLLRTDAWTALFGSGPARLSRPLQPERVSSDTRSVNEREGLELGLRRRGHRSRCRRRRIRAAPAQTHATFHSVQIRPDDWPDRTLAESLARRRSPRGHRDRTHH